MAKRYVIDLVIIAFAMGLLLISLCLVLFFSQVPNHIWNSVLKSKSKFPTKGNVFSGKYMANDSNVVVEHYQDKAKRFSGHEIFALLLQCMVTVVGILAITPTFIKKQYRETAYLVNMELVYGSLGLFTLPSVIALAFALQEYYSNIVKTLNDDDTTGVSNQLTLDTNSTFIFLTPQSWRSIEAACAINDNSIKWSGVVDELDANKLSEFTTVFGTKDINYNGSTFDHALLKRLGFCPHLSELDVAVGLLVASTILFFLLPVTNICFKHSAVTESATKLQEQSNAGGSDGEDLSITEAPTETTEPEESTKPDSVSIVPKRKAPPVSKKPGLKSPASPKNKDIKPSDITLGTQATFKTNEVLTGSPDKPKPTKEPPPPPPAKPILPESADEGKFKDKFRRTLNSLDLENKLEKPTYSVDMTAISDLSSLYDTPRNKKGSKPKSKPKSKLKKK